MKVHPMAGQPAPRSLLVNVPRLGTAFYTVSSSMIDRVAARIGRCLVEVPVGFKYFVEGLLDGSLGLAGEESAGASFLGRDGTVWTTDKDGLIMGLRAAEITARTGRDPAEHYRDLTRELGEPVYERIDAEATPEEKTVLERLSADSLRLTELAGEPVTAVLTTAPGNGQPIGGVKIITERLVRGPPLRHRGGLQALCGKSRGPIICAGSRKRRRPRSRTSS